MSEATVTVTHFSLKGSDFTRLVRDIFLSDDPNKAYRIIVNGLRGDGPEDNSRRAAEDVLNGHKRFDGNETDGITVKTERANVKRAYWKQVRYLYAGRTKINGKWYRPVAKVTSWGKEDLYNDHGMPVKRVGRGLKAGFTNRSWHYCDRDEIIQEVDKVDYVFEPCGEPPHWWQANMSAKAAVKDALQAGRTFETRGWQQSYASVESDESEEQEYESEDVDRDEEDEDEADKRRERQRLEMEEEDRREAKRQEARAQQIAEYRERILEQAHGDMLRLEWDGGYLDVPRAPFINWCVERRKRLRQLAPPWKIVCPTGLKMQLDSQYHTDWMVGAGLEISYDYHSHPAQQAAVEKMFDIQRELGSFEVTVLVEGKGYAYGKVHHGKPGKKPPKDAIVVLPNLSPKYVESVIGAKAVIAEAGGKTAHLAQVGLEQGLLIVVTENARERFPEGLTVSVDGENGKIIEQGGDEW